MAALALRGSLLAVFRSMGGGSDETFARGVAAAVKGYAESGAVTTTDAGTVSAGLFSGAGSGGVTCDDGPCAAAILGACNRMYAMAEGGGCDYDAFLAKGLAEAAHAMISGGEVSCNVSGVAVSPSGVSSPLDGAAKGALEGDPAPLQEALEGVFRGMAGTGGAGGDGDAYMAGGMANAVHAYLAGAEASTRGEGALLGSAGAGAWAPGPEPEEG